MKILLLTGKSPWPAKDGGAAAIVSLVDMLLLNNFQVSILAFNTTKHFSGPENIPTLYSKKVKVKYVSLDASIRIFPLLSNIFFSNKSLIKERFHSENYHKALSDWLKDDFDIVQAEGLAMAMYLPVVKSLSRALTIFRPHNVESNIWSMLSEEELNPIKKYYFRLLSRRLKKEEISSARSCDAIMTMTEEDMNWFSKYYKEKPAIVIPPALQSLKPEFVNIIPHSVAYIGSLDWLPNLNGLKWFISKVWPKVIEKLPDAVLRIAGRNPVRLKIKGRNIIFEGETESSSVFLCASRVMAIPLFSGSGIRMRIIEGMHLGRCIIATPTAVRGIHCTNGENIIFTDNSDIFADSVVKCLTDANYASYLSDNALKFAYKNFNIFEIAKRAGKFYNSLK